MSSRTTAKQFVRRKHIEIRFQYVVDMVRCNKIKLTKLSTDEMKSDFLIKNLFPKPFERAFTDEQSFDEHKSYLRRRWRAQQNGFEKPLLIRTRF